MLQDFIDNPQDGFALFQLKNVPENHGLRFTGMSELEWTAEMLRNKVHSFVESAESFLFHDKAELEAFLRTEGFTVKNNPDQEMITVVNTARQQADIYLTFGDSCCWIDGCDTRKAEASARLEHYDLVYSSVLPEVQGVDAREILEDLYARFNLDRPADFYGHSMSVSDVIVLKLDGYFSSYYTDTIGFREIPEFFLPENALKNAEMSMEDDLNMIDGIINNGPKQDKAAQPPEAKDIAELHASGRKPHRMDTPER